VKNSRFSRSARLLAATLVVLLPALAQAQSCVQWVRRTDVGTPGQRYGHAMAYDSQRGVTVFFGGAYSDVSGSEEFYDDTWEYDGTHWRKITLVTGSAPPPRANHGMCYYNSGGYQYMVMSGGRNGLGTFADTWLYTGLGDGKGFWSQASYHGEPYVSYFGLVFDEWRGVATQVGGFNSNGESIWEVWNWSNSGWGPDVHLPSDSSHMAVAYDSLRGLVCVQGGFETRLGFDTVDSGIITFSSTATDWGAAYPQLGTTENAARMEHAMVYDISRDRLVIFGGANIHSALHLEGNFTEGWRSMAIATPAERAQPGMVYDSQRGVTVLFGGVGGTRYDDTWELVPVPPVVGLLDGDQQVRCEFEGITIRASVNRSGLTFQWIHDGIPVPGGTAQYLTLNSLHPEDAGRYALVATDACGNAAAGPATTLVVNSAPRITAFDAARRNRCPGESVTFVVTATSTLSMGFQWYKGFSPIPGATASTLTLNNLTAGQTGDYWVYVRNDCRGTTSDILHLQVGPSILKQPINQVSNPCRMMSNFVVHADGVGTLKYQWRLDGAALSNDVYFAGVDTELLRINPVLYAHEGNYDVVVTDTCGPMNAVTSSVAKLKVLPGPEWVLRATNGPSARSGHAMAYDSARGVTVLFGGWRTNETGEVVTFNDLWEWDGTRWTLRMPHSETNGWAVYRYTPSYVDRPVHRAQHNLVYDSARGRMVLFGGQSRSRGGYQTFLNDTWEWDAGAGQWYFRSTNGPARRSSASMAYDSSRGVTVMSGGFITDANPNRPAVWEWDGIQWTMKLAPNGPASNYSQDIGAMVYDSFRNVTVFGPTVNPDTISRFEFWNWDGTNWARFYEYVDQLWGHQYGALAFDSYRRRSVWFGGQYGVGDNPTAFFDGHHWEVLTTSPTVPPGRYHQAMAYDSARHATVMFGGEKSNWAFLGDTWELIALDAPLINEQPASQYSPAGGTATFSITAAGPAALSYQWFHDGVRLANSGHISGSDTPTLNIENVNASDAGRYSTVVANDCGSTLSQTAMLTLNPSLQIHLIDNVVTLTWYAPGFVLEQAETPTGSWTELPSATSPYHPSALRPARFYRLKM